MLDFISERSELRKSYTRPNFYRWVIALSRISFCNIIHHLIFNICLKI